MYVLCIAISLVQDFLARPAELYQSITCIVHREFGFLFQGADLVWNALRILIIILILINANQTKSILLSCFQKHRRNSYRLNFVSSSNGNILLLSPSLLWNMFLSKVNAFLDRNDPPLNGGGYNNVGQGYATTAPSWIGGYVFKSAYISRGSVAKRKVQLDICKCKCYKQHRFVFFISISHLSQVSLHVFDLILRDFMEINHILIKFST